MRAVARELSISIEVHAETGQTRRRCATCLAKEYTNSITAVEQADRLNKELDDLIARVDRLIALNPETPALPSGLEGLAATPLNSFRTLLVHRAEVQARRQEILTQEGSEARSAYELKQAVAKEDFERAAELKRQREQNQGESNV